MLKQLVLGRHKFIFWSSYAILLILSVFAAVFYLGFFSARSNTVVTIDNFSQTAIDESNFSFRADASIATSNDLVELPWNIFLTLNTTECDSSSAGGYRDQASWSTDTDGEKYLSFDLPRSNSIYSFAKQNTIKLCFEAQYTATGSSNVIEEWQSFDINKVFIDTPHIISSQRDSYHQITIHALGDIDGASWKYRLTQGDCDEATAKLSGWVSVNGRHKSLITHNERLAIINVDLIDRESSRKISTSRDNNICLQVSDEGNDRSPISSHTLDLDWPVIQSVSQSSSRITAVANTKFDFDHNTWAYAVFSDGSCGQALTKGWHSVGEKGLSVDSSKRAVLDLVIADIDESESNKQVCFRVANDEDDASYKWSEVDTDGVPALVRISGTDNNDFGQMTVQATGSILANTWSYRTSRADTDCSSVQTNWINVNQPSLSYSANQAVVNLSLVNQDTRDFSPSNRSHICFRVTPRYNRQSSQRYVFSEPVAIDFTRPLIRNIYRSQSHNQTIIAEAHGQFASDHSTWAYKLISQNQTCSNALSNWRTLSHSSLSLSETNQALLNLDYVTLGSNDDLVCFRLAAGSQSQATKTYKAFDLGRSRPIPPPPSENRISARQTLVGEVIATSSADVVRNSWSWALINHSQRHDCSNNDRSSGFSWHRSSFKITSDGRQIILDITDLGIEESAVNRYICFRATDNRPGYVKEYTYGLFDVRPLPKVEVYFEGKRLVATSSDQRVDHDSWQYFVVEAGDHYYGCHDSTLFKDVRSRNSRVVFSDLDVPAYSYYCFRVADDDGYYGYDYIQVRHDNLANKDILVYQQTDQKRIKVVATGEDIDGLSWGYQSFSGNPGGCSDVDDDDYFSPDGLRENKTTLYVSSIADYKDGYYFCFRVADSEDNYVYARHRYDITAPEIKFSFDEQSNKLEISSQAVDLDKSSWRWGKFDDRVNCAKMTLDQTLSRRAEHVLTLNSADNDKYFCFKVSDYQGNDGYGRYGGQEVNPNVPIIEFEQDEEYISVKSQAPNLDDSSWAYAKFKSEPNSCGSVDIGWRDLNSERRLALKDLKSVNWLCFRVQTKDDLTGYLKLKIDREGPIIKIKLNNIRLNISSDSSDFELGSWAYAKSNQDFDCKKAEYKSIKSRSRKIAFDLLATDSHHYFCFRASDTSANQSYEKIKLGVVHLNAPMIKLTQNNEVLEAKASAVVANSWQYVRSTEDINCIAKSNLNWSAASAENTRLILSEVDNGRWFCFRVKGNNGLDGYAKILVDGIDTQAPVIVLARDEQGVSASTEKEETLSWHYVVLASVEAKCDQTAFANEEAVKEGSKIIFADTAVAYCLRATDAAGNESYQLIKTVEELEDDDTQPSPVAEETTDDDQPVVLIAIIVGSLLIIIGVIGYFWSQMRRTDELEDSDSEEENQEDDDFKDHPF